MIKIINSWKKINSKIDFFEIIFNLVILSKDIYHQKSFDEYVTIQFKTFLVFSLFNGLFQLPIFLIFLTIQEVEELFQAGTKFRFSRVFTKSRGRVAKWGEKIFTQYSSGFNQSRSRISQGGHEFYSTFSRRYRPFFTKNNNSVKHPLPL